MPLSSDPEKRRRQLAFLNPSGSRRITGLLELELENPKKITIKMNRTVNNADKLLIEDGEIVLNNIELVDPPENYSIKKFFESQNNSVQEGLARTFGRDKKITNELIQKRLDFVKNDWIFALPLTYENKEGRQITEDTFNFVKFAQSDKIKIAIIEPKKLLKLANMKEKNIRNDRSAIQTRNHIKEGKPIPTPIIQINKNADKVESVEGISRVTGALLEGVAEIPVFIITKEPIETMSRLERMRVDNIDFKKVN